jgi:hypothetical protein
MWEQSLSSTEGNPDFLQGVLCCVEDNLCNNAEANTQNICQRSQESSHLCFVNEEKGAKMIHYMVRNYGIIVRWDSYILWHCKGKKLIKHARRPINAELGARPNWVFQDEANQVMHFPSATGWMNISQIDGLIEEDPRKEH